MADLSTTCWTASASACSRYSGAEAAGRAPGELADFDPDEADTARAAQCATAPILILHGTEDRSVLPAHASALSAACGDRGRLVLIPGADHESIFADGDGVVRRESVAWFDRWLQPDTGR